MADDPENDVVVKPEQLIGGINGMIIQLHKFQVELDESKQKHLGQTEKIKILEQKNEECRNEMNELTKTKERLMEQSGFLEKSLNKKKAENMELLERLKQAEIQLGESGSVLATVRNLESKNEILSEKMSTVLLSTEEEIERAKTERGHYMKLLDETSELNKRNVEMQNGLGKAKKTRDEHTKQAKAFVEKSERLCSEISKTLDEIQSAKKQFSGYSYEKDALVKRTKSCTEENALLQQENKSLKQKAIDFETKNNELRCSLKEQQKGSEALKEKLKKTEGEKQELAKEVHSLQRKIQDKFAKSNEAVQDAKKNKQYEALEQQLKLLAESYGQATQQLGQLKESVDESKDMLKANMEKEENADVETGLGDNEDGGGGKIDTDYVAVVVEMQGIFQQSDIRDEELASLESLAGIQRPQRFGEVNQSSSKNEGSGMASCIRGLVAIKDSQITILMNERDQLSHEIAEKKKIEYRQLYQLNELQKENSEILAKVEAIQAKYRKVKDEKEDIRQNLLVKNAADKVTHSYINKLKHENEQYKATLQTQQETLKQQFQSMKDEFDKKLDSRNALLQAMQDKISLCQRERDSLKNELNSRQKKDSAMKEQIISIFGN